MGNLIKLITIKSHISAFAKKIQRHSIIVAVESRLYNCLRSHNTILFGFLIIDHEVITGLQGVISGCECL